MARARAPACGDNLFAVIRTAKKTIWRGIRRPYIHAAETLKHVLHARRSDSAWLKVRTRIRGWMPAQRLGCARRKFLHLARSSLFFPSSCICESNSIYRMETFSQKLGYFLRFSRDVAIPEMESVSLRIRMRISICTWALINVFFFRRALKLCNVTYEEFHIFFFFRNCLLAEAI